MCITTIRERWAGRQRRRRGPAEKAVRMPWIYPLTVPRIQCPRCRRFVDNTDRGRSAHGLGCVRIPQHRPEGWGTRAFRD